MDPEHSLVSLLQTLLPAVDPGRHGWFVEIGCGSFQYFFQRIAPLGFRSLAVEPLVVPRLRTACQQSGTTLLGTCVGPQDGSATMYVGSFNGQTCVDVSSLMPNWWGSSQQAVTVNSVTLGRALTGIDLVTALKLDVEGAEAMIVQQMLTLPAQQLPRILAFEFVGEGHPHTMSRPGGIEFVRNSSICLDVLQRLGYGTGVVLDTDASAARVFDLRRDAVPDLADAFGPNSNWGNVLLLHGSVATEIDLAAICRTLETAGAPA